MNNKELFISLLRETKREGIENVITELDKKGFFKKDYDQMISDSNAYVSEYEKDEVMGL